MPLSLLQFEPAVCNAVYKIASSHDPLTVHKSHVLPKDVVYGTINHTVSHIITHESMLAR